MPFGVRTPPRAGNNSDRRLRRLANAITSSTGGIRPYLFDLKGNEFVRVTTTATVEKIFFEAKHDTNGLVSIGVSPSRGGILAVQEGTVTSFPRFLADANGTLWFYVVVESSGVGNEPDINRFHRATAGGTSYSEAFAADELKDGSWMIFADGGGNASSSNITIVPQGGGSPHTFNGASANIVIDEDYGGILKVYDGTSDWQVFKLPAWNANGGPDKKAITETAIDITLDSTHYTVLVDASGAARTITLPAAASHNGRIYNIKKIDSSVNAVTVDGAGAETIDGAATTVLAVQYASVTIQSDGTEWWII